MTDTPTEELIRKLRQHKAENHSAAEMVTDLLDDPVLLLKALGASNIAPKQKGGVPDSFQRWVLERWEV